MKTLLTILAILMAFAMPAKADMDCGEWSDAGDYEVRTCTSGPDTKML